MMKPMFVALLGAVGMMPIGILFGFLPIALIVVLMIPLVALAGYGVYAIWRSAPFGGKDVGTVIGVLYVSCGVGFVLGMIVTHIVITNFKVILA